MTESAEETLRGLRAQLREAEKRWDAAVEHVSVGKPEASPNKVRFPDGFELDDPTDAEWLALYLLGWAARARKASSPDGKRKKESP